MVDVNEVIQKCVDDIWDEYDVDKNESLDRQECRRFILTTLRELTGQDMEETFNDDDFNFTFDLFDEDQSGTIEKREMVRFIKKVAGLSIGRT